MPTDPAMAETTAAAAADAASQCLAQWLAATAAGDRRAFRALYEATSTRLLGIAFEVLGDRDRAEEALQDAYVKVWHHADRFDPAIARPMTWLMRIVRNRAIDVWRSRQSERELLQPWDEELAATVQDPAPSPELALQQAQLRRALARALPALSPATRDTVALTLQRGLSPQELAVHSGIRPERARARLRDAAQRLQQELKLVRALA